MFVRVLDKFANPAHSIGIFNAFYDIASIPASIVYLPGRLQIILTPLFVAGLFKPEYTDWYKYYVVY